MLLPPPLPLAKQGRLLHIGDSSSPDKEVRAPYESSSKQPLPRKKLHLALLRQFVTPFQDLALPSKCHHLASPISLQDKEEPISLPPTELQCCSQVPDTVASAPARPSHSAFHYNDGVAFHPASPTGHTGSTGCHLLPKLFTFLLPLGRLIFNCPNQSTSPSSF